MKNLSSREMLSVIIVSWNAREYLAQCLESLSFKACRYPMEVIVVDNASADGSAEYVERQYPDVRVIRNAENLGFARANNIGFAHSVGKYVCFINSDVEVREHCVSRLVDYCEEHLDVGMVGPRIIGSDGHVQRSYRGFPTLLNTLCRALALDTVLPGMRDFSGCCFSRLPQGTQSFVDVLSGCFWLVRRTAIGEVGLLDESFFMYGEDMDWCKRFWDSGWKLAFVATAEAIHYGGASSARSPVRFYIEKQRADLQYWRKHHSRSSAACFFLISCLRLVLRICGYSLALCMKRKERETCRYKVHRSVACLKWMFTGRLPRADMEPS